MGKKEEEMRKGKKVVIGIMVLAIIMVAGTAWAGAAKGKAGAAVRDENLINEINAVKMTIRGMTVEIASIKSELKEGKMTDSERKMEMRLGWAERQINELWARINLLMIIVVILCAAVIILGLINYKKAKSKEKEIVASKE
jgi:hypothetical protein